MIESVYIRRFVEQLNHINDYSAGSLLLLFKPTSDSPNGERYEVLLFELKTGLRKEYFTLFLEHPDFNRYFIYPKDNDLYNTKAVKEEYNKLPTAESGAKYWS